MVTAERFAQGLTLPEYVAQMRTNRETFSRLLAEAPVRPEDREAFAALGRKIRILVITEDWCPDSLRTIPVLARPQSRSSSRIAATLGNGSTQPRSNCSNIC